MSALPAAAGQPRLCGPIERIVVLRALMLGDLLCAVPALRALRAAFPQARVTLIGLPWAREWVTRSALIDDFIEFPGYPGLPEIPSRPEAFPPFIEQVRAQHFDLALQLHGSGTIVNPLVAAFAARQSAGFFSEGAWVPDADRERYIAWPATGREIDRLLGLTTALGLPCQGRELEFPVEEGDRLALATLLPRDLARRYVCVHAGAQLPSRRWPASRFAAVGDALAQAGYLVVLTGSSAEAPLVAEVAASMRQPSLSLAGKTSLWTLGALIEGADGLVCNDTGVSHIAAALGTPSVVVSSGADVSRWAPLAANRHRVLWHDLPCRPCHHAVCPIGHGCATAIDADTVLAEFARLETAFSCRPLRSVSAADEAAAARP